MSAALSTDAPVFVPTAPGQHPASDVGGRFRADGVPPMPPYQWPPNRQPTTSEWIEWFLTLSGRQREYAASTLLTYARRGTECTMAMHTELLENDTLSRAQIRVQAHLDDRDGSPCPCCGQLAKRYRRKITSQIARALIAMFRETNRYATLGPDDRGVSTAINFNDSRGTRIYVHLPTLLGRTADEAKAAYWNLIEPMPDVTRPDGSGRTGWWRLTDRGRAYVRGEEAVPLHALVFNGTCQGFDGPHRGIHDALGTAGRYDDLMAGL